MFKARIKIPPNLAEWIGEPDGYTADARTDLQHDAVRAGLWHELLAP